MKSILNLYCITTHIRYRPIGKFLTYGILSFLSFISSYFVCSAGSHLGIPGITSFDPHEYKASLQNWDIAQDDRGVLYFGNNDGVLIFNGSEWTLFPLPNRTIVRSVEVGPQGFVYCGGQNAFGRLQPNTAGEWVYHSLVDSLPADHRQFSDVWEIHTDRDALYFRSSERIYHRHDGGWAVYDTFRFQFFDLLQGKICGQDIQGNLYLQQDGRFVPVVNTDLLQGSLITGSVLYKDGYLIATERRGLFLLQENVLRSLKTTWNPYLSEKVINKIVRLKNGDIVIGTLLDGVIILDNELELKYHLSNDNGLLHNNVMSLLVSEDGNLWIGLNKGINYIRVNSPFTYIKPDGQLDGIGYTAAVHKDKVYFGTNNGVFYTDLERDRISLQEFSQFTEVPGTKGQVWGLDVVDGNLFLSHAGGLYRIEDGISHPVKEDEGAWLTLKDSHVNDQYFVGTYQGVYVIKNRNGRLTDGGRLSDMSESSRFVEQDGAGNLWIAHPYRGIYRISHDQAGTDIPTYRYYDENDGLPSSLHNHVFKVKGKVVFCAEKGVYQFKAHDDSFGPYRPLNDIFGSDIKIRRLFEAGNGDLWYITENTVGLLDIDDAGLDLQISRREYPSLKNQMNAGWEFIYPYDDHNVFIASTDGFIHFDPSMEVSEDSAVLIQFNEIRTTGRNDSLYFGGVHFDGQRVLAAQRDDSRLRIPFRHHTLQFKYSAVSFADQDDLRFRYKLTGFDDSWSDWSTDRMKEFTRLKPGNYTLQLEARSVDSQKSGRAAFRFEITSPWYRSVFAMLLYTFLVLGGLFLFIYLNRRKVNQLREEVEETASRSRSEIKRLENEKITVQLEHKKRELVTSKMHLVQKNETMREIMDKLASIRKSCPDDATAGELKKLIHVVELDSDLDTNWEDLMYHFNEVHEDFFTNLKEKYPALTNKDLKLCAYLRMNLSTKEIAILTNVSHRGIDASRYRLRKKLDLDSEVNLTEFMMQF